MMTSLAHRILLGLAAAVVLTTHATGVAGQTVAQHQQNVVIRGGWLFTATGNTVIRNRGILIVAGRLMAGDRAITATEAAGARVVQLREDQYVLPGIFDVHAHYNLNLGPDGLRTDEYTYNPIN